MTDTNATWSEPDSRDFLDLAEVAVPGRREQSQVLLSLVPAGPQDSFTGAELACGEGLLAERLLDRFPKAHLLAFDGSDVMLTAARQRLARFGERAEVRRFDLAEESWLEEVTPHLRCVLSSLAVHHLTDDEKRRLFARAVEVLEPGGALLIADVIQPVNADARRSAGESWHAIAREQSLSLAGAPDLYERAVREGWAPPETGEPVPGEMPACLFDQLRWLEEAGFGAVDCFWMRAGIAIYGGYR